MSNLADITGPNQEAQKKIDRIVDARARELAKDGFYTLKDRPQVMNIISIPAPKRLWPRLIWAKIRQKFK